MSVKDNFALNAKIIIKVGVNLQKGEELYINSPIECADFAHKLMEEGYKAGAKKVTLIYGDQQAAKIDYIYADTEVLCNISEWEKLRRDEVVDKKACYIGIAADDPSCFSDLDAGKIGEVSKARRKAYKRFMTASVNNEFKWCVMSVPTEAWAVQVFPELAPKVALQKLTRYIDKTMLLDKADAVKAWQQHDKKLKKRCAFLNKQQFEYFEYSNSIGTNLKVKMPKNYVFIGGSEVSIDGCQFSANMPTQEVFSAPHRFGANGKLVSALPLVNNGKIVENFWFEFKDGKVINYGAEKGVDTLKSIIETDEGSAYLGEIAFVGYNNPIRKLDTLFYNTLFDENASCHFALGQSYASVKNCDKMTEEEKLAVGLNQSAEHVDFMVGTADLSIIGIKYDGTEIPIFVNGDFVI